MANWICLQIGARQHYANPRTLHKAELLFALITDAWVPPGTISSIGGKIAERTQLQRLTQRYHDDLRDARVHSFTSSLIKFELVLLGKHYVRFTKTEHMFEKRAISLLSKMRYADVVLRFGT